MLNCIYVLQLYLRIYVPEGIGKDEWLVHIVSKEMAKMGLFIIGPFFG